jgi:hypothetical protein
MILRAIFWIGLVSFLIPHEPDLGFGRPGAAAASAAMPTPSSLTQLIQAGGDVQASCTAHKEACAGTLSVLDGFQQFAVRSLDQVRADIEANRTKRQ